MNENQGTPTGRAGAQEPQFQRFHSIQLMAEEHDGRRHHVTVHDRGTAEKFAAQLVHGRTVFKHVELWSGLRKLGEWTSGGPLTLTAGDAPGT